ncbi:AAA domain-containing protein [Sphingobacterium allocomposti]|uniref:AAA domain-containing protein n=1 Tax=Sphingobacterium allocomposti TaxID=415956 RepID=A0A5S5DP23_9SPHI|nr:AAA family ATPase [Sphingobacterium composti Yoo et al. 2007 non Ten et al. 2007]TYP97118.1 AAA domain-containing protein [Sphingobacterium composti Yoo et al. 2007 non Ten et al. 2007]
MKNNTNWYVITGGPSTGKTTVVNLLSERDTIRQLNTQDITSIRWLSVEKP